MFDIPNQFLRKPNRKVQSPKSPNKVQDPKNLLKTNVRK